MLRIALKTFFSQLHHDVTVFLDVAVELFPSQTQQPVYQFITEGEICQIVTKLLNGFFIQSDCLIVIAVAHFRHQTLAEQNGTVLLQITVK